MFRLVVALLQLASGLLRYLERQRLIQEGERRQIARELARTAQAAALAYSIKKDISELTDEEVDAALRRDFRD